MTNVFSILADTQSLQEVSFFITRTLQLIMSEKYGPCLIQFYVGYVLYVGLSVSMVVIGMLYDAPSYCQIEVPLFLQLNGWILLAPAIIILLPASCVTINYCRYGDFIGPDVCVTVRLTIVFEYIPWYKNNDAKLQQNSKTKRLSYKRVDFCISSI